ncbi:MAG: YbjQ family protein [Patescibacteria group bacterium]|nr:YbjQ family protein [Patescibacteria group bacterium]MDD5490463.1 YbjQ family protein [Patescibacteria group bacterium]
MLISTTEQITGKTIIQNLGLVRGNTVRARNIGRDIMALAKNIVGGEVTEYTALLSQSREQAIDRMIEEAQKLGANAIVNVRFNTSGVTAGTVEILVYGTAVKLS